MDPLLIRQRVLSAHKLLLEPATSEEKLKELTKLLSGINPKIDKLLTNLTETYAQIEKIKAAQLLELSADALPETTPAQKKRKKLLLLFLSFRKSLHSEIDRVQAQLDNQAHSGQSQITTWGRIIGLARGPLGIVTLIAVAVVAVKTQLATLTISNINCPTIGPQNLPPVVERLLPTQIATNTSKSLLLPPLTVEIDATQADNIYVTLLGSKFNYPQPSPNISIELDGKSILGTATKIDLKNTPTHRLTLSCTTRS